MQKWITFTLSVLVTACLVGPVFAQSPDSQPAPLAIETIENFGITVGDASGPQHLVLDEQAGLLYIFSEGTSQHGNSIIVYDIDEGEFVDHLQVNQGPSEPLDLQFDPESGLLYALWRDRYSDSRPILTVINTKTMGAEQEIPDVETFAATGSILYFATADEIVAVNLSNNTLDQARRETLTPGSATGPMAVDPQSNRLYLARNDGSTWTLEILEANTFSWVNNYPAESQILNILPRPSANDVFFTTGQNGFRILYRVTADGELADLPYDLGPYSGAAGIALAPDGETLFYSNGLYPPNGPADPSPGPAIIGLNSKTLIETHSIPLITNVSDLVIGTGNQAFAVYPYDHFLYFIDLNRQTFDISNTLIRIQAVLVDIETGNIFISDTANQIRRLAKNSLEVIAKTRLENNWADYGFKKSATSGWLAHNPVRNQLYVSGLPGTVLDSETLLELDTLEPGGQITPNPTKEVLYVSNCGTAVVAVGTLTASGVISGTVARPDGLPPNPCTLYSQLDEANQQLYTIFTNGVPGSNGGNYLVVYDVTAQPTIVFSDTSISVAGVEPDPENHRAFVSHIRHSNRRLRTLDTPAQTYLNQVIGVWGTTLYSPVTNRLYLGDLELNRLLALDADTLDVVDDFALPPGENFRLLALDPTSERLFLANNSGKLMVVSPGAVTGSTVTPTPAAGLEANGAILSLTEADDTVFGRINSTVEDFISEARLYTTGNSDLWSNLSRTLPPYPLQSFAVTPDFAANETIFASVLLPGQSGGLYKSADGGVTWQAAMSGLRDLWVNHIFIDPNFPVSNLILAQTTYGGLHISMDGGANWEPLARLDPNDQFPISAPDFGAAFSTEGTVLASQALQDMYGLYRASITPSGQLSAWQPVFDIPASHLGLSPNGDTALAYGTTLWRSIDGGQTWRQVGAGLSGVENLQPGPFLFSPDFANNNTVYFFFGGASSQSGILFRSTDGGQSWQQWQSPDSSRIFTAITTASNGDFILGDSQTNLLQLPADKITWKQSALPNLRFPLDDIAVAGNDVLMAVSRQHGLFKSNNGGKSWQPTDFPARSSGFSLKQYQLALSPNYVVDETIFIATGLSLYRSTDGGRTWQSLTVAPGPESFQAQQVALSPNFASDQTLLASTPLSVYRSTDGGDTWQPVLSSGVETSTTDVLAFSPDGRAAYARFGYGTSLFVSNDGGITWQPQPSGQDESFSIATTAVDTARTLTAVVEFEKRLLQTPAWQNISEMLPEGLATLNALAYDLDGRLYVAGQGGIFYSDDNGQSWQTFATNGLGESPNITHLSVSKATLLVALSDGALFRFDEGDNRWLNVSIIK